MISIHVCIILYVFTYVLTLKADSNLCGPKMVKRQTGIRDLVMDTFTHPKYYYSKLKIKSQQLFYDSQQILLQLASRMHKFRLACATLLIQPNNTLKDLNTLKGLNNTLKDLKPNNTLKDLFKADPT